MIQTKYGSCNWARLLDDGQIKCRVRIHGSYLGISFVHEDDEDPGDWSQYIWPENTEDEISGYWWSEGNMSCDCNRHRFLPEYLQAMHNEEKCGEEIYIDRIVPFDKCLPVLELNESHGIEN